MDLGGVSTAEIEAVVVQQGPHDLEHSVDAAVPLVHALCGERGSSEILIIGLVLPDRMLSELEMRHQLALAIDCAAEARPQRQHAFEALALDDGKPLHLCVVQHANRLAQAPLELCGQRKVMQVGGPEIRRGNDAAMLDHSGEPDGNAIGSEPARPPENAGLIRQSSRTGRRFPGSSSR